MPVASPNIVNYTVGKGSVFIRVSGETNFRHIGNCPVFSFTPAIEKLEHFSSMEGVKTKDRTEILSKSGTLNITFEEMTPENLRLALLSAAPTTESGGDQELTIFTSSSIRCEVKFVGNNDIGPRWEVLFHQVDFIPSGEIPFISEEWMQVELEGECAAVNGSFGIASKVEDGA